MKTAILYASKTSTVKLCANYLCSKINNETTLIDINGVDAYHLAEFDIIILGSYIRVGAIDRKMKNWLEQQKAILEGKKIYVFLCCQNKESFQSYLDTNFEVIHDKITSYANFGAQIRMDKYSFPIRFLMKMIAKLYQMKIVDHQNNDFLDYSQMDQFIDQISG